MINNYILLSLLLRIGGQPQTTRVFITLVVYHLIKNMVYEKIDEIAYDLYVEACKIYLIKIKLSEDAIMKKDKFIKYSTKIIEIKYYYNLAMKKIRKEKLQKLNEKE